MLEQYAIVPLQAQAERRPSKADNEPAERSQWCASRFLQFLEPLIRDLDVTMDKRPLRTLVQAVEAILTVRNRHQGLLLSELGDALDGLGGGGGTKRLSRLIHHRGWQAQ